MREREARYEEAPRLLTEAGVEFFSTVPNHIIVDRARYDLWPGRDHWFDRRTKKDHRDGVKGLIRFVQAGGAETAPAASAHPQNVPQNSKVRQIERRFSSDAAPLPPPEEARVSDRILALERKIDAMGERFDRMIEILLGYTGEHPEESKDHDFSQPPWEKDEIKYGRRV